ncbi:hypothetical protein EOC99_33835, partial [Mesorhizobium sp. M7A.T.Ca.TU.009.01.1.1]
MNAIQNFAFEEHLVRVVDREGQPWFVGVDICKALELAKPENALSSLDEDERYTLSEGVFGAGSGPKARLVVSEPGVYRLVFRSRKPEAERFKRWLAHDVLPAIRKTGQFEVRGGSSEPTPSYELDITHAPLAAKVGLLNLVLKTRGREAMLAYMAQLGLPAIPAPAADNEPEQCLQHLLEADTGNGGNVSQLLALALAGVEGAEEELAACG